MQTIQATHESTETHNRKGILRKRNTNMEEEDVYRDKYNTLVQESTPPTLAYDQEEES